MVVIIMIPLIVKFPLSLTLEMGGGTLVLQDVLDGIMPNLLPLILSLIVFKYVNKGVDVNKLIFILLGLVFY